MVEREEEPQLLKVPQAARRLGVSVRTIYNLIERGELQRVKIGAAARVRTADVDALARGVDDEQ